MQVHKQDIARNHTLGRDMKGMTLTGDMLELASKDMRSLTYIGLDIAPSKLDELVKHYNREIGASNDAGMFGMDAVQPDVTSGSIVTPVQFLQTFLPGMVEVITDVRKADELVGITNVGAWHDQMIVQGLLERQGPVAAYSDRGNTEQTSWNLNFETRDIQRFETGLHSGRLEQARASEVRVDSAGTKRAAGAVALEIQRNNVAFYGYHSDAGTNTYGILNDPGLGAYTPVSVEWNAATWDQIKNDILRTMALLRIQSTGNIDPSTAKLTMGIALSRIDYLDQATSYGVTVREWMNKAYPNVRIVGVPQFDAVDAALTGEAGAENVLYMFADTVADSGSDDNATWVQAVPTKYYTLGVQQLTKGYEEAYSNATAGVFCKRPYAVARIVGI